MDKNVTLVNYRKIILWQFDVVFFSIILGVFNLKKLRSLKVCRTYAKWIYLIKPKRML